MQQIITLLRESEPTPHWREHDIALDGYCAIDGGEDAPCTAIRASMVSLTVRAQTPVKFLDRVVMALPHIALVESTVAETFEGGFLVRFPPAPSSKLGTYVSWLEGESKGKGHDMRRHERLVPVKRLVTLSRSGEPPSMARIVDLSRSGVAFTTSKQLAIGEPVRLGSQAGFIVRLFEGGGAADFTALLREEHFGAMIDLERADAESPAAR